MDSEVCAHETAGKTGLSCCQHGRLEFAAAVKRHVREGRLTASQASEVLERFRSDEAENYWHWFPVSETMIDRAFDRVWQLSDTVFLRAADALHLTCAAERGLDCVYSHDRHFLAAAPHFGLQGHDIIR